MMLKAVMTRLQRGAALALGGLSIAVVMAGAAEAARQENGVAHFSGLDKITGRITEFDVYLGETVQFGALQVTPRVCYSRPRTEKAQSTTFIEVDELMKDKRVQRIFTGWMFASNPGVHGVEHPVYDIWLVDCRGYSSAPVPANYEGPQVEDRPAYDGLAGDDFVSSGLVGIPQRKP